MAGEPSSSGEFNGAEEIGVLGNVRVPESDPLHGQFYVAGEVARVGDLSPQGSQK